MTCGGIFFLDELWLTRNVHDTGLGVFFRGCDTIDGEAAYALAMRHENVRKMRVHFSTSSGKSFDAGAMRSPPRSCVSF